ncbi:hypothetical protein DL93DRAFT_2114178 [Clavulina sp. PMI_390]|nr:hypothetical protein DL93DRAFT_2114178 [Clavulina sp. PMI_390]
MILHGLCMSLAFFAILPIAIVLRNAKHKYHIIAQSSFLVLVTNGWLFGMLYRSLSPNLYPGESHSSLGYVVLLGVLAITGYDFFQVLVRLHNYVRNKASAGSFWKYVIKGERSSSSAEYGPFRQKEQDELEHLQSLKDQVDAARHTANMEKNFDPHGIDFDECGPSRRYAYSSYQGDSSSTSATGSGEHWGRPRRSGHCRTPYVDENEDEIGDIEEQLPEEGSTKLSRFLASSVYLGQWGLMLLAYTELVTGIVVYTGICQNTYGNGCLAHLIKGSNFFLYGILTFCRYLGAFAVFGWAWNRAPTYSVRTANGGPKVKPNPMPSAEMIECFTIFLYGISNTWLERQGSHAGDPFKPRQVQHISIAVMYWFGGLVGMALESKRVRRLLSLSAYLPGSRPMLPAPKSHRRGSSSAEPRSGVTGSGLGEPASYTGSFNPIPPLVTGITGAAMSAHVQPYVFLKSVHILWGNLLLAFAVMRCLTYIVLWLRPPTAERSVLPSRPPTEALGSIFLACGGLVFMSSTEEIEFTMMRNGHDDIMMLLNMVLAITCIVFCWCVVTLCVKGWARSQAFSERASSSSNSSQRGDITLPLSPPTNTSMV